MSSLLSQEDDSIMPMHNGVDLIKWEISRNCSGMRNMGTDSRQSSLSSDMDLAVEEGFRDTSDESIFFNGRFMAGQVFTPELWGAMLGRDFYMPATIELLEALLLPHVRGQSAFCWQIRVPPRYVNRPFSKLFKDLLLGGWDAPDSHSHLHCASGDSLNMVPPHCPAKVPERSPGEEGSLPVPPEGPVLALAIYRRRDDVALPAPRTQEDVAPGTGDKNYNILSPPANLSLRIQDWVLVLGSEQFRSKAQALGFLRGSTRDYSGQDSQDVGAHAEQARDEGGAP
jgi:hypothetical protein